MLVSNSDPEIIIKKLNRKVNKMQMMFKLSDEFSKKLDSIMNTIEKEVLNLLEDQKSSKKITPIKRGRFTFSNPHNMLTFGKEKKFDPKSPDERVFQFNHEVQRKFKKSDTIGTDVIQEGEESEIVDLNKTLSKSSK